MEAAIGCGWWETDTAAFVTGLVAAGPVATVFTSIAHLLRNGEDPEVVVGATTADAAFAVACEWVDAGIDPGEVQGWLRAGCWKPTVAKALTDAGLGPEQLLDDCGKPRHWIEIPTPDGQQVPLARAVAEEFVAVQNAIPIVTGRKP